MGSPSNVDIVEGVAKVLIKDLTPEEWCCILQNALRKAEPCLKYVAGFTTLKELLNCRNGEVPLGHKRLVASSDAMPSFAGTKLTSRSRFVVLQVLGPRNNTAKPASLASNRDVLLLSDDGYFALLVVGFFNQKDHTIVGESKFFPKSVKRYFEENSAVRDRIADESISPYSVLDKLYLLFYGTVVDREKRLESMRAVRNSLEGMVHRLA